MSVTVFQCLKERKKRYAFTDKRELGKSIAKFYRETFGQEPKQVMQNEGKIEYTVYAYPDEFKPIMVNIINDYFKDKK
jgi:hypothetical protein